MYRNTRNYKVVSLEELASHSADAWCIVACDMAQELLVQSVGVPVVLFDVTDRSSVSCICGVGKDPMHVPSTVMAMIEHLRRIIQKGKAVRLRILNPVYIRVQDDSKHIEVSCDLTFERADGSRFAPQPGDGEPWARD